MIPRRKKTLLLAAALVSACIMAFALRHIWETGRHSTRQTLCVHNLKFFAITLNAYANTHDGRFPDRLSQLWPEYLTELEIFICPELQAVYQRERGVPHPFAGDPDPDTIEALSSYAYVPGHITTDAADVVIVYEKVDNHLGKGRSLLYLDGHGAWEPPENWRYGGRPNTTLPPGF